ncbi:MAG: GGDEF domain-containing protein [Clostridiaceae bacterium]|nr:GGDEF domain-containing protein [Clostridiaceae bacterium]
MDRWIGEYELANSKVPDIKIVVPPIETHYSAIAVRKGDTETLALINSGLKAITEDGTFDRIMEQWQGKQVIYLTKDYLQFFYLQFAVFFLVFVALISIYFVRKYRNLNKKLELIVKERTEELRRTNEMLKSANLKLGRMSMLDGLTSIENRRAFDAAIKQVWESSTKEEKPLALIMIDIDYFKIFNDTYGHLSGDQTLKRIAEVIQKVVNKPGNLAARYGGEEFAVMLLDTVAEEAAVVAEEIRRRIEELGIENMEGKSIITVSLGVASVVPVRGMEPDELIEAADKALYKAKESGRNRVVVWE